MSTPVTFAAGQPVTAAQLNTLGADVASYTPALTSTGTTPTMGSGAVHTGFYVQANHLAAVWFDIAFGSSMASGTGNYQISLPVNVAPGAMSYLALGHGMVYDDSGTDPEPVEFFMLPGAPSLVRPASPAGWVGASSPITWAQSDRIVGSLLYPADW